MSENTETAILAGGCFWPAQELLRHRDGVISTRVGYTGGVNDNPTSAKGLSAPTTVPRSSMRAMSSAGSPRTPSPLPRASGVLRW